jgi:hypothetical protein
MLQSLLWLNFGEFSNIESRVSSTDVRVRVEKFELKSSSSKNPSSS